MSVKFRLEIQMLPKPGRDKYQYSALEFGPVSLQKNNLLLTKWKCTEELGKGKYDCQVSHICGFFEIEKEGIKK